MSIFKNKKFLVLLLLSVCFFCLGATPQKQTARQTNEDSKIVVYYFHGNNRCYSCKTIERYTRESVETNFAKELKSGQLEFKSINVDLPVNSHYIKNYRLYTRSVIVSDIAQGKEQRWKNLQKVWELLHEEAGFKAYVQSETAAYLQGKRS